MGKLILSEESSAPGTPASGRAVVYIKSDGLLYWKDDAGVEYPVTKAPTSSADNAVARFDGTGGKTLQNSLFIVDDTGHVSSFGGQIAFPATQAASAGANTLDDYEEGTWTPVLQGSGGSANVYSIQLGRYVKIGKLVISTGCITCSTVNATGPVNVVGLPFTSVNANASYLPSCAVVWSDILLTSLYTEVGAYVVNNATQVNILQSGSNQPAATISGGAGGFDDGSAFNHTAMYEASS